MYDPRRGISNLGSQYGLDQSGFSASTQPGKFSKKSSSFYDWSKPSQITADMYTQKYASPGAGEFTRTAQSFGGKDPGNFGAWTDASGSRISDLPGYIKMREQQKAGSDFSGYQNQLNELLRDPSKVQQTAGYQFALDQGNQAINRSAAAKGMLSSGNVLAELAKYGQGMASQQYNTEANRLADLMMGSQQFGLQSGYYQPPPMSTMGGVTYRDPKSISPW